ncbi:MAG: cbb3-type cytochrome c oxidase subunit II [Gemmataceae bacterium]
MKYGPIIFLGVFFTFATAWFALIYIPYVQIGFIEPVKKKTGEQYPVPLEGEAAAGEMVYARNGCLYCHSQQARRKGFGADFERGWGPKRGNQAPDYIYDRRVMLGSMRTGPDLATIGKRQSDAMWHHLHLYDPQMMSPGSIMSPYPYLYRTQKIEGEPSEDALDFAKFQKEEYGPPEGYEIVPTDDARALVAYLLSLKRDGKLK